jgi:hypothetical protein
MNRSLFAFVVLLAAASGSAALFSSCIEMCSCPSGFLGDYDGVSLTVKAPEGGSLGTVGATFKGAGIDETMQCQGSSSTYAVCAWNGGGPEDAGTYQGSLQIEAQGYQTATVTAAITVVHEPGGSCCYPVPFAYAQLAPTYVVLEPAVDGGM